MNIYKQIEDKIKAIVEALSAAGKLPAGADVARIEATPPKDPSHGDIATNAAMVLAAQLKAKPQELAATLLEEIKKLPEVAGASIAGVGFINMVLQPGVWQALVPYIVSEGRAYGNSQVGAGIKVNVEYVSANPTGPMHVGHGRGAVVGDALATLLLKAGYSVTKEYYINDGGAQIDKLAEAAFLRYREALGEDIGEMPEGLYPGEYMKAIGEGLAHQHKRALLDMPREKWLPIVRAFAVDVNMATIKEDLAQLGIQHDVFSSEQAIIEAGLVEKAIAELEKKGLIYIGTLEPPKGKAPDDWEARPQTLFRSTQFGDDADRPVKKSDGSWTYFAPDIAYHWDKIRRGHTRLINMMGADHGGYVKRISAAVTALSDGKATCEVKLCQLVKFMRNGEPMKMSKRAGTFVTVREVVDEVGRDVFRFIMLTRKNDVPLDFDFAKAMEQSKDNPVFYVQYAHARARSVLRHAGSDMPEVVARESNANTSLLTAPEELALLKIMAAWPRIVEQAARAGEAHRVAFYLQEVAAAFHALWNRGNEQNTLRFLQKDDIELTAARMALLSAFTAVIASGLMVLGVEPVEELRG